MVLPRTEGSEDALTHVLTNVFQIGVDHPWTLVALGEHGYHDIHNIINASRVVMLILKH
jgi:hypothetical protein